MGLLAALGGGLFLGLGLMIWGLRERSKRHAAEKGEATAKLAEHGARMTAANNAAQAMELEAELKRVGAQLDFVRSRLSQARERLIKCEDPQAIKEWLDAELGPEVL
jgi:hypothetical protein